MAVVAQWRPCLGEWRYRARTATLFTHILLVRSTALLVAGECESYCNHAPVRLANLAPFECGGVSLCWCVWVPRVRNESRVWQRVCGVDSTRSRLWSGQDLQTSIFVVICTGSSPLCEHLCTLVPRALKLQDKLPHRSTGNIVMLYTAQNSQFQLLTE